MSKRNHLPTSYHLQYANKQDANNRKMLIQEHSSKLLQYISNTTQKRQQEASGNNCGYHQTKHQTTEQPAATTQAKTLRYKMVLYYVPKMADRKFPSHHDSAAELQPRSKSTVPTRHVSCSFMDTGRLMF